MSNPERQIFGDTFIEKFKDSPELMRLVEETESRIEALVAQYGVDTWEELPEEVLATFVVDIQPDDPESGVKND